MSDHTKVISHFTIRPFGAGFEVFNRKIRGVNEREVKEMLSVKEMKLT